MSSLSCRWIGILLAPWLASCGGDDGADSAVELLDPEETHYGKSYEEWAASWLGYINSVSPPDCASPHADTTGATCALYQDPASPVFFLVGTFGGPAVRRECPVPAGKALFFPLVNNWGDNAGVPEEMQLGEDGLEDYAASNFETVATESLFLRVDGGEVSGLTRTAIPSARYVVTIPPGENVYSCAGVDGVEGDFPGYLSGYWALLAPLPSGDHVLEFGGRARNPLDGEPIVIDVRYEFTLE